MLAPGLGAPLLSDSEAAELYSFAKVKEPNYDGKTSNTKTIHFKGSIVTHPDTSRSHAAKVARYLSEGKCKFGVNCLSCSAFIAHALARDIPRENIKPGRCELYKNEHYKQFCKGRARAKETGQIEKTYEITPRVYRDIANRVAWMKTTAKNRLLFCVLTFPNFKKDATEKQLNECFSKFVENLTKTYHLSRYLAVRENNGLNNRIHYHCIFDIPFISFARINRAWCKSIRNFCDSSPNAFRTSPKNRFIRDAAGAVRYVCKYVSKCRGVINKTRIVFCDHETARAYVTARFNKSIAELKKDYKTIKMRKLNSYVSEFTFTSRSEQNKFFNFYVRSIFNCFSPPKSMYHFSGLSPGEN